MFCQGGWSQGPDKFVDSNCRVYKDWNDFLLNNQFPECNYCYPRGGVYDGDKNDKVIVEFSKTPACNIGNKLLSVLDTASSVVMVSSVIWFLLHMHVHSLTQSVQPFVC
jgi:hypothetical protein